MTGDIGVCGELGSGFGLWRSFEGCLDRVMWFEAGRGGGAEWAGTTGFPWRGGFEARLGLEVRRRQGVNLNGG